MTGPLHQTVSGAGEHHPRPTSQLMVSFSWRETSLPAFDLMVDPSPVRRGPSVV